MKLNYRRTILIGLAFLSICAFWQFYDNEIPKILTYTFGLGETWTGVIMALDNVLALFLLPIFGSWSDKVDTKVGKRMPFILIGTFLATVLLSLLIAVANKPGRLALFIFILLLLLIAMGIYRSPAVSLMPDLTPAPLRSKANAVINLMGAVGGVYALLMTNLLLHDAKDGSQTDYVPMMISIVLIMIVAVVILFFTINEKKISRKVLEENKEFMEDDQDNTEDNSGSMPKDVLRSMIFLLLSVFFWYASYNAVTTAFSRYVVEVWHLYDGAYANCLMVATVAAIISYIPIGSIAGKIGRKKTILIGVALMILCYLIAAFMPTYHNWLYIMFGIIGFGWAAINVNSYPMVVEMSSHNVIGKYTGTYYVFSMAAQVFTPVASGFLLEHVSYRTLFPYAVFFSVLAFITMAQVKHGDSKPIPKKSILERMDVDN
ncbi:MAG: MFS transporter [Butyrivibrio sp.]|nr:MFS transporter [Butyrivibrio sp.]